jgi:hypothetical protein
MSECIRGARLSSGPRGSGQRRAAPLPLQNPVRAHGLRDRPKAPPGMTWRLSSVMSVMGISFGTAAMPAAAIPGIRRGIHRRTSVGASSRPRSVPASPHPAPRPSISAPTHDCGEHGSRHVATVIKGPAGSSITTTAASQTGRRRDAAEHADVLVPA